MSEINWPELTPGWCPRAGWDSWCQGLGGISAWDHPKPTLERKESVRKAQKKLRPGRRRRCPGAFHPSASPGVWELPAWMGSSAEPLGTGLYLPPECEMWIKQSWQGNYSSLSNIALGLLAADSPRVMNPFVFAAALEWLQEKVQTGREVLH